MGAAIGDLNADGRPDIVVLSSQDGALDDRLYVFVNNGSGGFDAPNIIDLGSIIGSQNDRGVAIGDFNGDGKPDLVVHTVDPSNTEHIWFLAGKGDGTFATPVDRGSYGDATQGIVRYAAVDMNGDGRLDLVGLGFGHGIYVSFGNGDGTFQASHQYSADQGAPHRHGGRGLRRQWQARRGGSRSLLRRIHRAAGVGRAAQQRRRDTWQRRCTPPSVKPVPAALRWAISTGTVGQISSWRWDRRPTE